MHYTSVNFKYWCINSLKMAVFFDQTCSCKQEIVFFIC